MECTQSLVEEAIDSVRYSIEGYLISNCHKILSMAKAAEQKYLRMYTYGFFRYFNPSTSFYRFEQAYTYVLKCLGPDAKISIGGVQVELKENYIVFPVNYLEKVCMLLSQGK